MSKEEIAERVLRIVRDDFRCAEAELSDNLEYLGLDSLAQIELVMCLEQEFEVELPDGTFDGCATVQDFVTVLANY